MLEYQITASSKAHSEAEFQVNGKSYHFGIVPENEAATPMDLLLGAFAACVLKNVERFSGMLKFEYESASIEILGSRSDKPPALHSIKYVLKIKSKDLQLNAALLMKNIQKFGTIYNTLKQTSEIEGTIEII